MAEPVSTAQYFPWSGGAVFVGTAGAFPAHAHQAIQICFLFDGRIRMRTTDADEWRDYDLAIVPSRHSHGMDGSKIHCGCASTSCGSASSASGSAGRRARRRVRLRRSLRLQRSQRDRVRRSREARQPRAAARLRATF